MVVLVLPDSPVEGQGTPLCPGATDNRLAPLIGSYQQLTVSSTAVSLTVPAGAEIAVLHVETDDIRYRDDGTAPTSTIGMRVEQDTTFLACGLALSRLQMIRVTTDATVGVSYYGRR